MAITKVIDNVTAAIELAAATPFIVTDAALVTADNFSGNEAAVVYRLGPSGDYNPVTSLDRAVVLSSMPNTVKLDGPGTFKVTKTVTAVGAYVGYEE